jgi:rhodanese-related sulfurtransferase
VDFIVNNWYLFVMAAVSGGMLLWPALQGGGGGGAASVNTSEAVRLMNREKGVLVDVSEPAEHAAGHPNGARHIPFGQLEGSKDLPSNKALPIVLVCPTGMRASKAASLLRKAGYTNATALAGGFKAWREANLPVEKSAA